MGAELSVDSSEQPVARKRLKEALAKCGLDPSRPGALETFAGACRELGVHRRTVVPAADYGPELRRIYDTKSSELLVPPFIALGVEEAHAFRHPPVRMLQPLALTG